MDEVQIVGAGGIGCAVGFALLEAGIRVTFVEVDEVKVAWGRQYGVRIGARENRSARFEHFDNWDPPRGVPLVICTKCYDNDSIVARLPNDAIVIPIQNGFDDVIASTKHCLEGIASFISECEPGRTHTRITRQGRLYVGVRHPHGRPVPLELTQVLARNRLFRVQWAPDILPYKYTKLMYNAAIGPLAALAGLDNGSLLSDGKARSLFFALLRENYEILCRAQVPLATIGPFHPKHVARILRRSWLAHGLAWAFYPSLRRTYCSMANDVPTGRTEVDYYIGHLLRLAPDFESPLNRSIHRAMKLAEATRSVPGLPVLNELDFNAIETRLTSNYRQAI